ncbi:unnamed protein product [Paramecium sonneborni]|uniref:Uncharacterized protein n=1 Tax=Paramecium sonneborni TaxID=65129 RepID=A0A8S1RPB9_9CILI|nr:unnamed protein product [Paramecium sonneborni]
MKLKLEDGLTYMKTIISISPLIIYQEVVQQLFKVNIYQDRNLGRGKLKLRTKQCKYLEYDQEVEVILIQKERRMDFGLICMKILIKIVKSFIKGLIIMGLSKEDGILYIKIKKLAGVNLMKKAKSLDSGLIQTQNLMILGLVVAKQFIQENMKMVSQSLQVRNRRLFDFIC